MTTLIITNGDSAADRLKETFDFDNVLPWRDVLHEGPVRFCASLMEQSMERAQFIAGFAEQNFSDVLKDFQARDGEVLSTEFDEIELWFEHDLYDQLQLLQILHVIKTERAETIVKLVQADDYLCEISDEAFKALPNCAIEVSEAQFDYASEIWNAYRASDHTAFRQALVTDGPLKYVAPAMKRLLQEYPDDQSGLPLSMRYALYPLTQGEHMVVTLFKSMMAQEEAKFMGDLSFAQMISQLMEGETQLIQGAPLQWDQYREFFAQTVSLSEFGTKVMDGQAKASLHKGRWLGGVKLG